VVPPGIQKGEYQELAALFFLQAMANGMWLVPLSTILAAHGLQSVRPYAFATTAVAALVSPLIAGAMADRHASPVAVLRALSMASAGTMCVATFAIQHHAPPASVLTLIQVYALCAVPTGSICNTVVFSRLRNSQRQFGPIRAAATVGWICGCLIISALHADGTSRAGYVGAAAWFILGLFTFSLPSVPPPPTFGSTTMIQRLGWDALALLRNHDHRVVFITAALLSIPIAAFYPYTPQHLQNLGFQRISAWMALGQVTEVVAMFTLGQLFTRWRLKWIFVAGLGFSVLRYLLCAMNGNFWLLSGIFLHGLSFTLFFITAQIYLNERVDTAWRARAQALMSLMNSGIGYFVGYLFGGFWLSYCSRSGTTQWSLYWSVLAGMAALVLVYFLCAYHGVGLPRRVQLATGKAESSPEVG
jgi:nucleoside transporter